MTNDIETRYLLVTLPDTTGEEADWSAEQLQQFVNSSAAGVQVNHAPQLWVLTVCGPEFDWHQLFATEQECLQSLIEYAVEGGIDFLTADTVIQHFCDVGYIIDIQRHNYPVHPHQETE